MTEYRTESVLFAFALILAIAAASVTTVINTPDKNGAPIGTTALAQPSLPTSDSSMPSRAP